MKLTVKSDGKIKVSEYYFQTLCMIFWPGAKFGVDTKPSRGAAGVKGRIKGVGGNVDADANTNTNANADANANTNANSQCDPLLNMDVESDTDADSPSVAFTISVDDGGAVVRATIADKTKLSSMERRVEFDGTHTREMTVKLAAGAAMLAAGEDFMHYSPSWGVMTGVRPAKVASDYLRRGFSAAKTRSALRTDYCLYPKKAALVTEIAQLEARIAQPYYSGYCSVYISIPFCPSRCAYCSFVAYTSRKLTALIPDYVDALCHEIELRFRLIDELGLKVASVYIGGGTPTILTEEQLTRVLETVASCTDVSELAEYTLEAGRPDTITIEKLRIAKRLGVTRVSVNTQTINDEVLRSIGRAHTAEDFYRAFEMAVNSGIDCINTDLIAGLPGENFLSFSKSFDRVIELHPENITVHTFTVKKAADILKHGASVYSRVNKDAGKSVDYSQIRSKANGYRPYYIYRQKNTVGNYENVGFALDGYEGLYNIFMMEEIHSVISAGAGSVNRLVLPRDWTGGYENDGGGNADSAKIRRIFTPKYPYEYLKAKTPEERDAEFLAVNEKIRQFYAGELADGDGFEIKAKS